MRKMVSINCMVGMGPSLSPSLSPHLGRGLRLFFATFHFNFSSPEGKKMSKEYTDALEAPSGAELGKGYGCLAASTQDSQNSRWLPRRVPQLAHQTTPWGGSTPRESERRVYPIRGRHQRTGPFARRGPQFETLIRPVLESIICIAMAPKRFCLYFWVRNQTLVVATDPNRSKPFCHVRVDNNLKSSCSQLTQYVGWAADGASHIM